MLSTGGSSRGGGRGRRFDSGFGGKIGHVGRDAVVVQCRISRQTGRVTDGAWQTLGPGLGVVHAPGLFGHRCPDGRGSEDHVFCPPDAAVGRFVDELERGERGVALGDGVLDVQRRQTGRLVRVGEPKDQVVSQFVEGLEAGGVGPFDGRGRRVIVEDLELLHESGKPVDVLTLDPADGLGGARLRSTAGDNRFHFALPLQEMGNCGTR